MKTRRSKPATKTNSKINTRATTNSSTKPSTNSANKSIAKASTKPTTKPTNQPNAKLSSRFSSNKSTPKPITKTFKKPLAKPRTDKQTILTVVEGSELLKFLIAQMPEKGRSSIKSLLAHRQISVDGEVTTLFNYALLPGQQVFVNWTKAHDKTKPKGLKILFEDDHLIVIDKPAGMLSIATVQEKELTAYNILSEHIKKRNKNNRIFVVHRLDRGTSGVMMFAKSEEIKKSLQNAWKDVVLDRNYIAVVEGSVTDNQGTITSWLNENKALRMYSSSTPNDGQKAVTHYKVLKRSKLYSLLEVKLETGRKNQIRVHMQDIGHSVIGDIKYGGAKSPINRLGLHAHILAFKHPTTEEDVHYESPVPPHFLSLFGTVKSLN